MVEFKFYSSPFETRNYIEAEAASYGQIVVEYIIYWYILAAS